MTVWVWRDGALVEKSQLKPEDFNRSFLPTPNISRLEPYRSPIDGKEITSWAQRDKDLRDSNSIDPRDLPRKKPQNERPEPTPEQLSFKWGGLPD